MNGTNCSCRWEPVTWQIVYMCLLSLEFSNEHLQKPGGTGGCRASLEFRKDMCHLQQILVLLVWSLSHVQLFATPWTVASQAPLSMGFSRQEYWSGLLCPPPGDLPNPGIKLASPALASGFFFFLTTEPPGKPPGPWPTSNPFYRVPSVRTMLAHLHCKPP